MSENLTKIPSWIMLNNQILDSDGKIKDVNKDKEAVREYFIHYVNNHTKFFHSLKEKIEYLTKNEYWEKEFLEKYQYKDIKSLFRLAYSYKFRFPSYMSAFKFYNDYALKDRDNPDIFLERYEDRLCIVALYHADGDIELAKSLLKSLIQQDFTPATPTLLNTGKAKRGEMVSCFLFEVGDSLNDISRSLEFAMQLSKIGGGVSLNLSSIRGRGESVKGSPNASKGVVGVLKLFDNAFRYADQMGQRPGAGASYLSVYHSDIEEFLATKKINADDDIRVRTLSIGVILSNLFIEKAKKNEDYYVFYPHSVKKVYDVDFADVVANIDEWYDKLSQDDRVRKKSLSARKLLTQIASISFESGYPYIFFQENVNKGNVFKNMKVKFSNLCLTGDTMIAVADGRNAVSLEELATYSNGEKSFLVYSSKHRNFKKVNLKNGGVLTTTSWQKPEIQKAVAYCTGVKPIVRVTLSNGDSFKCTANHLLGKVEGGYVEAKDSLECELQSFYSYSPYRQTSFRNIQSISDVSSKQSILIWEYYKGQVPSGHVVDHIVPRGISLDDSIENLQIMSRKEHLRKSSKEMLGKNNSVHRIVDKEFYKHNHTQTGVKNSNFCGVDNYELIRLGQEIHKKIEGEFTKQKYLKIKDFFKKDVPVQFSNYRFNGDFDLYKKYVLGELVYQGEFDVIPTPVDSKVVSVNKERKDYIYKHFLNRVGNNLIEKGVKVVRIESLGDDLVYDLTVENNNNFYILTSACDDKYENSQGVLVHNCTEILQPTEVSSYADYWDRENDKVGLGVSCNLSSGHITNMIKNKSIKETVESAMTLMSSVSEKSDVRQVPEIAKANSLFRSVGFGTMDLHGFFVKHNIFYGSPESIDFVDVFYNMVNYYSLRWSMEKARSTGKVFAGFSDTTYSTGEYFDGRGEIKPKTEVVKEIFKDIEIPNSKDWRKLREDVRSYGLYNSHRLAIAPNGSIGYVMNATPGVSPIKNIIEERMYGNSKTFYLAPYLTEDNSFLYETAYNIDKEKLIDVIATIQKHIDQGISLEICVNSNVTTRDLLKIHLYAHHKGIKTLYYTRTNKLSIAECLACAV